MLCVRVQKQRGRLKPKGERLRFRSRAGGFVSQVSFHLSTVQRAGVCVLISATFDYNVFAMTLNSFLLVSFNFGSKTISETSFSTKRSRFFRKNWRFFAFSTSKNTPQNERERRERTTTRTTENGEDDNHDDATTTRNAKPNDHGSEYHPVGRGRFGTTGDE